MLNKLLKFLIYSSLIFLLFLILLIQISPIVDKQTTISPKEMSIAKDQIKHMADKLASHLTFVEFTLSNDDLQAISKLGTHLLPNTSINIATSNFGVLVASTTEINVGRQWFLNISCWLVKEDQKNTFEECHVGNLPLPSFLVEQTITGLFALVFSNEISNTVNELIANASYSDEKLLLTAQKSKFFREEVNNSLNKIGNIATLYTQSASVPPELIQQYVLQVEAINSDNLSDYIRELAIFSNSQTAKYTAQEENTATIWALAIVFGDYRFASLMGVKKSDSKKSIPKLRGRIDSTQHFIFSAVIQQLSDVDIGLSVGEAKELLDSLKGGSGYSFADLAADKAGLAFAKHITTDNETAQKSQHQLMLMNIEDTFFPYIHDLPEGFRDNNFKRVIGSTATENYKKVEAEVDLRIANLPLYKRNKKHQINDTWLKANNNQLKTWYKIDTHIHTKFSDGSYTVEEVAKQAFKFGCDAIAITDHGDHNLKKVVSHEYFSAIEDVQKQYSQMTIIPALEWNIPPFNGREHVTVLLPESQNLARNLAVFRDRYDHYNRFDEKVLSPTEGLDWLNKYGEDQTQIKPVLIYNHPNRKDFQQQENAHDYAYWRKYTDLFIGFSGAPGHQKKRGLNNGSYEQHIKTVNGWDPSIENIGGEWDQLLQQGYKIWAARAASDFHNDKMDYWPCQFSSTHVQANSNQHNDILLGLREGNFWAQHGNFINNINFVVKTNNQLVTMGQETAVQYGESIKVNLTINLNNKDWQGNLTSLDDLELIIITENSVKSISFYDQLMGKNLNVTHELDIDTNFAIFRWRGKSIQAENHHYMFYTNPIKISTM